MPRLAFLLFGGDTMMTRGRKKFLIVFAAIVALGGTSISLAFFSLIAPTYLISLRDRFALYSLLSFLWMLVSAAALFIRTKRQVFWIRFVETEISLRTRRGLRVDNTRQVANGRWFPIFAFAMLVAFLVLTILSARAFLSVHE